MTAVLRGTPSPMIVNREHWLTNCAEIFVPLIESASARSVPPLLISVSLPTKRGLSLKKRVVGQCFPLAKKGKKSHLFIHPQLIKLDDVVGTVAHEVIHTLEAGHGRKFGAIAAALSLSKPWTGAGATKAMWDLTDKKGRTVRSLIEKLGKYPHEALDLSHRSKVAKTYLLKIGCPGCGMPARVTLTWLESIGLPTCACGTKWVLLD